MDYHSLPTNATQDGKFLERLLNESVQKESENPIIIVVDALDEVDQVSYRGVSNILFLPSHLPNGVYFILTLRRGVDVPMTVYTPFLPAPQLRRSPAILTSNLDSQQLTVCILS